MVLPCFVTRRIRGVLVGMKSMFPYHYGGLLADRTVVPDVAGRIADRVGQMWLLHTLIVSASPKGGIAGWERYQSNSFSTHVLDLAGGFGRVWKQGFSQGQRNRIRKAMRSGVCIRKDNSAVAVDSFYKLYLMSSERLGYASETKGFFERLLIDAGESADLWLARKGNQDIGGVVVTDDGRDTAYAVYAASDERYWALCPNNLLFSTAIEDACASGLGRFDFLPSGRIASLERFKETFGAEKVQVPEYWISGRIPAFKPRLVRLFQEVAWSEKSAGVG